MSGKKAITLDPPSVLEFKLPVNDAEKAEAVTAELRILNTSSSSMKFKVKTTAPKKYCVKPNSGELGPGQSETVAVMLQPDPETKKIPRAREDCRDKFLVQSVVESDCVHEHWSSQDLWKLIPQEKIVSTKLKCAHRAVEAGDGAGFSAGVQAGIPAKVANNNNNNTTAPVTASAAGSSKAKIGSTGTAPAAYKAAPAPAPVTKPASAPTAPAKRVPSALKSTAVAKPAEGTQTAKLYVLVLVFVLGVVLGKFLL